jgi:hypothetical protein
VNSYFRLYKGLTVTKEILENPAEIARLSRPLRDNDDCLAPIFYHQLDSQAVREMIREDPLFRIEGFEKTVNYQRING